MQQQQQHKKTKTKTKQTKKNKQNEWMKEIPTVPIHYLAKPQPWVSLLPPIS